MHENTIRNWSRDGLLEGIRLPGSRFLRFRVGDVEALVAQRSSRAPSLQSQRRAMEPELATANHLKQWPVASSRDAQERFPELVRRLLIETPGITNISVRAGDGIALEGYDGFAESTGSQFLPAGELVFEFGVDGRPEQKATSDYNKRASNGPSSKSFVFATPRRWAGGAAWAEERRKDGNFLDVKVVDADDLEGWLLTAPAAHYWISEHLGLRPRDAVALDKWWERFSTATKPALPAELFLAGRQHEKAQLEDRLNGNPTLTLIQSEWTDDCLAFLYAARSSSASTGNPTTGVVVSTPEAWDSILEKPGKALLIPVFEDADVGRAINRGHHVVSVVDRSALSGRGVDLKLPRLGRRQAADALQEAGVDFGKAERLAALGRKSLPALYRGISLNPRISRPEWATPPESRVLAALLLAGAWTSDPDDIATLEAMVDEPWDVIEPLVSRLSSSADPLIRRVGSCWSFVSQEEAFLVLEEAFTAALIGRSLRAIDSVLSESDPVLELSAEKRSAAGLLSVQRRFSSVLREGLAQGLALLGALGSDVTLENGVTAAELAANTVGQLLDRATKDESGRRWHELAAALPMLAEAAPDVFLEAVEDDLSGQKKAVLGMFADQGGGSLHLGPSSTHHHLLWALEALCWSPDYLIEGVRVLTRLASLDPGGKSQNRPLESLRSILCGWVRHTSASREERLQALDVAYHVADEIGWKLTVELLPNNRSILLPPADPRFRDWKPAEVTVLMSDWITFIHSLVDRAIRHAGCEADRLAQLAEAIPNLPPADRDQIIETLAQAAKRDMSDPEGPLLLWERLRELTAHHKRYASADWALPEEIVERLAEITSTLEPGSEPERFAYLFDWRPDLPDIDFRDFESYRSELTRLRIAALLSVTDSTSGTEGLEPLVRRSAAPGQVGSTAAEIDNIGMADILPWLSSSEPALNEAGAMWVRRKIQLSGPAWFIKTLAESDLRGVARDIFIRNAPTTPEVWQAMRENQATEDEALFWKTANFDDVPLPAVQEVVKELSNCGRIWSAISVVAATIDRLDATSSDDDPRVAPSLVVAVLNSAITRPSEEGGPFSMTTYCVGTLLDYLSKQEGHEMAVAKYEFTFYRLLEHQREPSSLNRVLATQPEHFVELVEQAFRSRSDQGRNLNDAERGLATQAWWVLHQWKGFPGRRADGSLDGAMMASWVKSARLALAEADRSDIGDEIIGQALANSPVGDDGVWPSEPVRELLETIGSRDLESGLVVGRLNTRGVTWRGLYDGGIQERELEENYRRWSASTRANWPRTARVLREIADAYKRDARRQDTRAELDGDRS